MASTVSPTVRAKRYKSAYGNALYMMVSTLMTLPNPGFGLTSTVSLVLTQ
jgi:hypothetical protein